MTGAVGVQASDSKDLALGGAPVHPRARVIAVAPMQGGITAEHDRVTVQSSRLQDVMLRALAG